MIIEPFRKDDIDDFLHLAARENWVAERWEFDFLLRTFPQGCCTARDETGQTAGFVTALRHHTSGWIGNLIVAEQCRGRGIGEALFLKAMEALRAAGVETIWLTASASGMPLYQKHGFERLDTIIRWAGTGRQRHAAHEHSGGNSYSSSLAGSLDCQAWGDRRDALLQETIGRGRLVVEESGFVVVQPCGDARQFGPFMAQDSAAAERIFYTALRTIPLDCKIYLDAPVSNRVALRMFNRRRLRLAGTTELMYAGTRPGYHPELIYGLATMGSCG